MPGRLDFEIDFAKPELQPVVRKREEGPMRILLLGDFTGRANRGLVEHGEGLAERPTPAVDVDNLDDVLFRFAPRLHLPLRDPAAPSIGVEIRRMEDFHPDALYRGLDVFRAMRGLRGRMVDPATWAAEAEELKRSAPAPADSPLAGRPGEEPPPEEEGAMFERLLGRKPDRQPRSRTQAPREGVDILPFIRSIVAPYVVAAASTEQEHLVASIDEATGMQMRDVLHHSDFRELEAAWRGVEWSIQRIETGEDLRLCLLDVSKDELLEDLGRAGGGWKDSGLYRLLVERTVQTPGGRPWSLLAGDYEFGPGPEDVGLLRTLGMLVSRAGAPFVASASPALLGCRSLAEEPDPRRWRPLDDEAERRWSALRSSAAAHWVGLALPRFLLRLPYGRRTEEIEAFAFEEQTAVPEHEAYLWGNPAFACAALIAAAFSESGWSMEPGDFLEVEDLPAHGFEVDGESRMTPCAEAFLTETAAEAILRRGVMPLLSYRDRNAARLLRFQSLAEPAAGLSGPWG